MNDTFDSEMSPVFEAYGKACFTAQMLESTLRFLLVLNKSDQDDQLITQEAILNIEENTKQYTLNKLFRFAQEKEYFTSREKFIIIKANQDRNYIIHNFWDDQDNLLSIPTKEGRIKIINKLFEYSKSFREADRITVSLIDRYLVEYNLSTDLLKQISPTLLKKLNNG